MSQLSIYLNPRCSKCRTAQGLLTERGIEARLVEYLDVAPTGPQLQELMEQLDVRDGRAVIARPPERLLELLDS